MDNNKLYNALLKTQQRQKAERAAHPVDADLEETASGNQAGSRAEAFQEQPYLRETQVNEEFRRERPYTRPRPSWTIPGPAEDRNAPSLYDSSVSLELIDNPRPWLTEQLRERKIIYPAMANKAILDAFRAVRIKLRDRAGAQNFSVMVSSLGEDNSALTAYNLAVTFAMDSQTSALLVDCNPWHEDLAPLVSSPMKSGVTDFIADRELDVKDIIYPSGIDRLSVIPAGTQATSAVELFSSARMKDLMSELKGRYPDRYLIINAPPFKASTEAHILMRYASQVVLGVPFGEVTPEDILSYVETLGSEKFSGLIFQQ